MNEKDPFTSMTEQSREDAKRFSRCFGPIALATAFLLANPQDPFPSIVAGAIGSVFTAYGWELHTLFHKSEKR